MTALAGAPNLVLEGENLRVLDFDIEAQPGAWFGGDFVTKRVLAIAATWVVDGQPTEINCWTRSRGKGTTMKMLKWFSGLYNEADLVTGHFIRGYDLIALQGGLMRYRLPLLEQKLTQDTKLDMVKASGISKSQENLGALYRLEHPKIQMSVPDWEEAGDLTPEGLAKVKARAIGDVEQHIELRNEMLKDGTLGRARMWYPNATGRSTRYTG